MSDMTDVACDSRNLSYTREYMHGLEATDYSRFPPLD